MEPTPNRIVVYSKDGCPFCSLLKNELRRLGHSFEEFDLSDDATRAEFYAATGVNTVPQLFLTREPAGLTTPSGTRIGGWSEVSGNWNLLGKPS